VLACRPKTVEPLSTPGVVKAVKNLQSNHSCCENDKLNPAQIKALLAKGKTYTTKELTFKYRVSAASKPRMAIIVSKKVLRLAVQRNYVKRVQRIHFSQHQHALGTIDVVVIANKSLYNSKLKEHYLMSTQAWYKFLKSLSTA